MEEENIVPEEAVAEEPVTEPEVAGPDYTQLLYEYMIAADEQEEAYRAEELALYSGKLDNLNMQLTETRAELVAMETRMAAMQESLEWTLAFLMFIVVINLFDKVRSWLSVMSGEGGKRNVR